MPPTGSGMWATVMTMQHVRVQTGSTVQTIANLKPRWQGIQTADKWMVANEAGAPCICMACMPDWSGIFMRTRLAIATLIFTGEHNILFFHIAFHFLCSQGAIYVTTCIFFSGLGDKLLVALCAQTAM